MAEGAFIQVPVDQAGKRVETTERTTAAGQVVERQRMVIPDPVIADGDIQRQILIELRVISFLLAQGFGFTDSLDQLRIDVNDINIT